MRVLEIPQLAWYGDTRLKLEIPEGWRLDVRTMKGHNATPMTDRQIAAALTSPVGTNPISQIALGRKEAVIMFDDLTRPPPCQGLCPRFWTSSRGRG